MLPKRRRLRNDKNPTKFEGKSPKSHPVALESNLCEWRVFFLIHARTCQVKPAARALIPHAHSNRPAKWPASGLKSPSIIMFIYTKDNTNGHKNSKNAIMATVHFIKTCFLHFVLIILN